MTCTICSMPRWTWMRVVSAGFLAGCAFDAENTDSVTSQAYAINTSIARPAEDPILELAQQVEGFAGFYCENANLVVGMAGPVKPAQDALAI